MRIIISTKDNYADNYQHNYEHNYHLIICRIILYFSSEDMLLCGASAYILWSTALSTITRLS